MSQALDTIRGDIWSVSDTFKAIGGTEAHFEAEAGFAIQALMNNEYAMGVAMRNRQSVINAVQNIAAIGISLNPARKQAYLVPRDGKICLDISYMGLMDLAMQSGSIRWAQCAIVYERDEFALHGLDKQPSHTFNPFSKDRGPLIGVYCVVKTSDGDYLTHTMSADEVFAIRDKSQSWIAFVAKKTKSCIWVDHEGEMVKKTCVKQAHKYWPKGDRSARVDAAIHYMNTEAGEGLPQEHPKASIAIPALVGAMEAMPIDVQQVLREIAPEAERIFKMDGEAQALDFLRSKQLDDDETKALWTLLPSDMRAALKKESQGRREASATLKAAA
ncbi:MAG: hypothetical protein RLZZ373_2645 [Pseudomonadota bacterium]